VRHGPLPAPRLLAMPVEGGDLAAAAANYQRLLEHYAGTPRSSTWSSSGSARMVQRPR